MLNRAGAFALTTLLVFSAVAAMCSDREEQRAVPEMVLAPGIVGDVSIEADLTLPRVASNRQWYGIWLMLLGSGQRQPFLQVGLMRRQADADRGVSEHGVGPFVAFNLRGKRLIYRELPSLAANSALAHHFVVGRRGKEMFVSMDGIVLHRERADDILNAGEAPTFQLAAELFSYGDRAVGTIENIRVRDNNHAVIAVTPQRFLHDRGTCIFRTHHGYAVRGTFTHGGELVFLKALPPSTNPCPFHE